MILPRLEARILFCPATVVGDFSFVGGTESRYEQILKIKNM